MGDSGKSHAVVTRAHRFALSTLCVCALLTVAPLLLAGRTSPVRASTSLCSVDHCGLHADGPYPNYVIGTLAHVGTDTDVQQVFQWAKRHGYWKSLPNSLSPYLQDIKLVTIRLPRSMARQPVSVFVTHQEYATSPYRPGDLVRYSPHGADHEVPPHPDADDVILFHGLTGCVALLCRQGDSKCRARYVSGVFTKSHGREVNLHTGQAIPDGRRIDPISLFPVK